MPGMSARITVRTATDDDDLDALNAGSVSWPGAALIRSLNAASDVPTAMLVGELDGVPAGYAGAVGHGVANGRRGIGQVYVLANHRRQGLGTALWQAVLEVVTPQLVVGISAQVDEADTVSRDVVLAHGFVPGGLHHHSELDLGSIDGLRELASAPRAEGVTLRQLPDDADEGTWRAFATTYQRLFRDAPDFAEGHEEMPYPVLRAVLAEPWQVMGAWRGDELVGLTAIVERDPSRGRLNTWFTGVAPDHRGLGLATALKAAQAFALRDAGWRAIVTQNLAGNDAILAANRRLGFRRGPSVRDMSLDF
jgi:GNAT superfamily N-acetyltransferase